MFFPLATCSAGENNCYSCNTGNTACETCYTGYAANNGVCQGNLFVYTVLLPLLTITYVRVLVRFTITRSGLFRALDVQERCIFGDLHTVLTKLMC